jgi:hypothetical protein
LAEMKTAALSVAMDKATTWESTSTNTALVEVFCLSLGGGFLF